MSHRASDAAQHRTRRNEQQRLRSIVERVGDGILVVTLDGTICFSNPAAEKLFGRTSADLRGSPLGFPAVVGDSAEIDIIRSHGSSTAAELRVVDLDWEGQPARLVTLRDITDRRKAAERTEQLERERIARVEAEAASNAKSEFLAVMSHELRTPLNAVIGYAELLDIGIDGPLLAEQRKHVARISKSGRHLLGLVNEVLDLSKIEAGAIAPELTVARAGEAADSAASFVQPAAEAKGVQFVMRNPADLVLLYAGDEDRVRQILINLLNNAVKFTDAGGTVTLECGVGRPDVEARVSSGVYVFWRVSDSGMGIPKEKIPSIFDPFVQVERGHTRQREGSGLGLTISRKLARLMNGDVTVRSTPGEGSVFTLWLKRADPASEDHPARIPRITDDERQAHGFADVGEALLAELGPIVRDFVARIRSLEIRVPTADLRTSVLADHVGSYIADLAGVLIAIEDSSVDPNELLADAADIQRLVAERHGAQRARLGWTQDDLLREWNILGEEVERALRLRSRKTNIDRREEALTVIRRFMVQGRDLSCRALTRASRETPSGLIEPADTTEQRP